MAMYAEPQIMVFDAPESTAVDLSQEPNAVEGWYYWGKTGNTHTALNLSAGAAIPTTYDSVVKNGIDDVNIVKYGYNRWSMSAYRQWLNSDAAKNEGWWTSQHLGDAAPDESMVNKPGWLYGFTDEWKSIFKKTKIQTLCNAITDDNVIDITYDKFFLPSTEQMYSIPDMQGTDGTYWEYWKNEMNTNTPTSASNEARQVPSILDPNGVAYSLFLRSAYNISSSGVGYVYSDGRVAATQSYYAMGCQPSCVIF